MWLVLDYSAMVENKSSRSPCLCAVHSTTSTQYHIWFFTIVLGRRRRRRTLRRRWLPAYEGAPQTPPLKKKDPIPDAPLATTPRQNADLWKDKEKWFEASFLFIIESVCTGHQLHSPCISVYQFIWSYIGRDFNYYYISGSWQDPEKGKQDS